MHRRVGSRVSIFRQVAAHRVLGGGVDARRALAHPGPRPFASTFSAGPGGRGRHQGGRRAERPKDLVAAGLPGSASPPRRPDFRRRRIRKDTLRLRYWGCTSADSKCAGGTGRGPGQPARFRHVEQHRRVSDLQGERGRCARSRTGSCRAGAARPRGRRPAPAAVPLRICAIVLPPGFGKSCGRATAGGFGAGSLLTGSATAGSSMGAARAAAIAKAPCAHSPEHPLDRRLRAGHAAVATILNAKKKKK